MLCHIIYQKVVTLRLFYGLSVEEEHGCERTCEPFFENGLVSGMSQVNEIQQKELVVRIDLLFDFGLSWNKFVVMNALELVFEGRGNVAVADSVALLYRKQQCPRLYIDACKESCMSHSDCWRLLQTNKRATLVHHSSITNYNKNGAAPKFLRTANLTQKRAQKPSGPKPPTPAHLSKRHHLPLRFVFDGILQVDPHRNSLRQVL